MAIDISSIEIIQNLAGELRRIDRMVAEYVEEKIREYHNLEISLQNEILSLEARISECEEELREAQARLLSAQMSAYNGDENSYVPAFFYEEVEEYNEKLEGLTARRDTLRYKANEIGSKIGHVTGRYRSCIQEYHSHSQSAENRLSDIEEVIEKLQRQEIITGNNSGATGFAGNSSGISKSSGGKSENVVGIGGRDSFGGWTSSSSAWGVTGSFISMILKAKKAAGEHLPSGTGMDGTPRNLPVTQQQWQTDADGSMTYNMPAQTGGLLDADQGKVDGYLGTCGLCSCVNVIRLSGAGIEEASMVDFASKNGLCMSGGKNPELRGGTSPQSRQQILKSYGIDSFCCRQSVSGIARYVSEGRGVIISVDAGALWYDQPDNGMHAVTVTSVRKDREGRIKGFFICDSGTGGKDGSRYISAEKMKNSLSFNQMNVTSNIIR